MRFDWFRWVSMSLIVQLDNLPKEPLAINHELWASISPGLIIVGIVYKSPFGIGCIDFAAPSAKTFR